MSRLVIRLSDILGVPVVDSTGEKRSFDSSLNWVADGMQSKAGIQTIVPDGPSVLGAGRATGLQARGPQVAGESHDPGSG